MFPCFIHIDNLAQNVFSRKEFQTLLKFCEAFMTHFMKRDDEFQTVYVKLRKPKIIVCRFATMLEGVRRKQ